MLIYLEKKAKEYPVAQSILKKLKSDQILETDHYKNIFDKQIWNQILEPAIIIAKNEHPSMLPVPPKYGYPGKSFFFKSSLNCIFDCEYCYLKGNFKTQYPVIFVNYEDIQDNIALHIHKERKNWYIDQITFYASNYSDIQGLDILSGFNQSFIPFMEQFDNVLMETRTKSANIQSFLESNKGLPPKNTEIAFSLNPQDIIQKYEKNTAPLWARIQSINTLLKKGYKVWLRFLPLLPVPNYEKIYIDFLKEIKSQIPMQKINSLFIASLIYNAGDFKQIQKKNPNSDLWHFVAPQENGLVKISDEIFETFIKIFERAFPENKISFDFL